jgi:predicted nucleotidyltransferase
MAQSLHPLIQKHLEAITEIAREYGVRRLDLVGSMARRLDGPESDADFLFSLREADIRLGFRQFDLEQKLAGLIGRRVEMLDHRLVKPWWRPILDQDRVTVYDDAA